MNASCNWVDLLQVSSVHVMQWCYERALAYEERTAFQFSGRLLLAIGVGGLSDVRVAEFV